MFVTFKEEWSQMYMQIRPLEHCEERLTSNWEETIIRDIIESRKNDEKVSKLHK